MSKSTESGASATLRGELAAWDPRAIVEGQPWRGSRHEVWAVIVRGQRCVARRSARTTEALEWELDLVEALARDGTRVPKIVPTLDGRRHLEGLVVSQRLDGRAPRTDQDWRIALGQLQRVHAQTSQWPQRPTFASTQDLLTRTRGGDVRLDEMPSDVVEACREAWRGLSEEPMSVIHGDPGAGNILVDEGSVAIIDWDEARVDASTLDLADLPLRSIPGVAQARLEQARRAADAWEAAAAWFIEPSYARRRLVRLRHRRVNT